MKKFMTVAVALICMTVMSVVFTSCSKEETTVATRDYTLKTDFQLISQGELSASALASLKAEFANQQLTNKFISLYDAKANVDAVVTLSMEAIEQRNLYATGCEYKVYYKLYDDNNYEVYSKTIYIKGDQFKIDN